MTFWCLKHFPRWLVNFITYCAALYFFVFDKRCRQESVRYQKNLKAYSPAFKKIKPLRQVATFAVTIVEKIDCWTNPIPFENIRFSDDDAQALIEQLNQGKGAFIIISHLGDSEVLRSLANKNEIGIKGADIVKIGKEQIRQAMCTVGLDPDLKKAVGKYSLGMRQRLGIAQAIMEDPGILLLDEPMNGLDNEGVGEMRKLLLSFRNEGRLILIASHTKEDIDILCDEVYHMDHGTVTSVDYQKSP